MSNPLKINKKEWIKISAIVSFILLSVALIISGAFPAAGYELDIYLSTPMVVWLFICIAFISGIAAMFYKEDSQSHRISGIWLLGLLTLIISRIILLYIPYIRGYESWWGDNISYLGQIRDILANGHWGFHNFYPITHIILAEVITVTTIPDSTVAMLSTTFVSIFFVLSIYLLAGAVFGNTPRRLLATLIAGSVLLAGPYNVLLTPNGWSILFLPFLFYLYFKQSSSAYRTLLIIILVTYPFFHPISCLVIIISLFILAVFRWFFPRLLFSAATLSTKIYSLVFLSIEIIIFSVWAFSNPLLSRSADSFWQQITMGIGSDKPYQLAASLNKLNVFGIDFLNLIFKLYGSDIILLIISAIGILLLLKWMRNSKRDTGVQNIIPLAFMFLIFAFLYIAYLLGVPGTAIAAGQQDRRFLSYVEILIPIFAALTFDRILQITNSRSLVRLLVVLTLIATSILSILSLYPSTYVSQPNMQVTKMDMLGMNWFVDKKDPEIGCVFISSPPSRFSDAILGYETTRERLDISVITGLLPDHFGYSEQYLSLGSQYTRDYYATMTKYDRTVYSTVWKNVGRFNNLDFEKLELDSTVNKLYSNNEMDVYYIRSVFISR